MNRHKTLKSAIVIMLLSFVCSSVMAQKDTISRERTNLNESVIITTQFDPVVNEAVKLTENPSIFDTVFEAPSFKYDIINKVFPTRVTINPITAAKVKSEKLTQQYKWTLLGGIGTYITPYFEAFYSDTQDNSLLYGAHFYHYSSHYSIKDYAKSHFMDNSLDLYTKKIWKEAVLDAYFRYDNSVNYYYGFKPEEYKDVLSYKNSDISTMYNNVSFKAVYKSLYHDDDHFNHIISLKVEDLIGSWNQNEFSLNISGDISKVFSLFDNDKQLCGISIDYNHLFDKFKYDKGAPYFAEISNVLMLNTDNQYNTGIIDFRPYFNFKIQKFELHTALSLAPEFGHESSFHFLPNAEVYFPIVPAKVFFKGGLTAQVQRESLYSLVGENPFVSPILHLKTTQEYRLYASLILPLSERFEMSAEGGLNKYTNHTFFTHDDAAELKNMFSVIYDDATRVYVKANARYDIEGAFALKTELLFQSFNTETLVFAPYEPKFIASLSAEYKPTENLTFDIIPVFKTATKAMFYDQEKHLKPIFDLNLAAQYQYDEQWAFFARVNNVAFQQYQEYYNCPSQRLMFMLGAKYMFD